MPKRPTPKQQLQFQLQQYHRRYTSLHKNIFTTLVLIAVFVTCRTILTNRRSSHDSTKTTNGGGGGGGGLMGSSNPIMLEEVKTKTNTNEKAQQSSSQQQQQQKPVTLKIYKTLPPLPNNQERKILLIHIGRGGGMTFKANTAVGCLDLDDNTKRDECFHKFPSHNKLASLTKDVVHVRGSNHPIDKMDPDITTFVVLLRDPIERVISAYRYSHPANCRQDKEKNHGCTLVENNLLEKGSLGYTIYKKCFPSAAMEDFVQAILPPYDSMPEHWKTNEFTTDEIVECRTIARQMVQGIPHKATPGGESLNPHMENNYEYFAEATYKKYPSKELFAIRTEQILQDMKRIDRLIGGQGKFPEETANIRTGGSQHYSPSPLSDSSLHKLCCVLEKELNVYIHIFEITQNLDSGADRAEANFRHRSTCGVWDGEPWIDWRRRCWKAMEEPMA